MYLVKLKNGTYSPAYESDWQESNRVAVGDEVKATRARNPLFHRKFFALINLMFDNQDDYKKGQEELFRKLMIINAGYYDEAVDKDGKVQRIPRSIAFENMSQADFEKLYEAMLDVAAVKLRTAKEEIQTELINFM